MPIIESLLFRAGYVKLDRLRAPSRGDVIGAAVAAAVLEAAVVIGPAPATTEAQPRDCAELGDDELEWQRRLEAARATEDDDELEWQRRLEAARATEDDDELEWQRRLEAARATEDDDELEWQRRLEAARATEDDGLIELSELDLIDCAGEAAPRERSAPPPIPAGNELSERQGQRRGEHAVPARDPRGHRGPSRDRHRGPAPSRPLAPRAPRAATR